MRLGREDATDQNSIFQYYNATGALGASKVKGATAGCGLPVVGDVLNAVKPGSLGCFVPGPLCETRCRSAPHVAGVSSLAGARGKIRPPETAAFGCHAIVFCGACRHVRGLRPSEAGLEPASAAW